MIGGNFHDKIPFYERIFKHGTLGGLQFQDLNSEYSQLHENRLHLLCAFCSAVNLGKRCGTVALRSDQCSPKSTALEQHSFIPSSESHPLGVGEWMSRFSEAYFAYLQKGYLLGVKIRFMKSLRQFQTQRS